jgi:hypothetical protein
VVRRLKTFDMVAAFKPRRPPPPVRREAAVTYNVLVIRVGFRSITGANIFVPCEEGCAMVRTIVLFGVHPKPVKGAVTLTAPQHWRSLPPRFLTHGL